MFAGGGAGGEAVGGEMQFLAMAADPADTAGRIADHQRESRDVLRDYRTRIKVTYLEQKLDITRQQAVNLLLNQK